MLVRGLEFGTQAFDRPRSGVIAENKLFDSLLCCRLPAKSKIESGFLLFQTRTPESFQGVDDIERGFPRNLSGS